MIKKRFMAAILIAGLLGAGGTVTYLRCDFKEQLKGFGKGLTETLGLKKVAKKIEEKTVGVFKKAKRTFLTVKALAKAFIVMSIKFNKKLLTLGFYDTELNVEVPLDLPEEEPEEGADEDEDDEEGAEGADEDEDEGDTEEGEEGEVAKYTIGLEYSLGFVGAGEIDDQIDSVEGLFRYSKPIKLGKKEMPVYAAQFLQSISKMFEKYRILLKNLTFIPVHKVIEAMQNLLKSIAFLMRLRPETVFQLKALVLLNSVQQGKENIYWFDVPVHMLIMLARLAESVNESASRRLLVNRGKKPSEFVKEVYFKDTGISNALKLKWITKIFPLIDVVFKQSKFKIPRWMLTENKERIKQKVPTKFEKAYSEMRMRHGHLAQSVYFLEVLLQEMDKFKMDKTDKARFMKLVRVHASRRYLGFMKQLGISVIGTAPETGTVVEKDLVDLEMNRLAVARAIYEYRWPALIDVLEAVNRKMAGFGGNQKRKVASLLAQVKQEREFFNKTFKEVTWPAELPPGKTLDDIGEGEHSLQSLSEEMRPKKIYNDPFLKTFKDLVMVGKKDEEEEEPAGGEGEEPDEDEQEDEEEEEEEEE